MWPRGVASSGVTAGIKSDGSPDLGLIACDAAVTYAGVFTRNAAAAPSVRWNRGHLGKEVRAVVVNSGNANACTGARGEKAVEITAAATARTLACDVDEVLVASTGPIGVHLDTDLVVAALPAAAESLDSDPAPFAAAIMTTDTHPKVTSWQGSFTMVGVAKGAAMVAPGMATMLAFIATDASVEQTLLQGTLAATVERTFNRISIDACESTNDSVICLAGTGPPADPAELKSALESVCGDLAEAIARDAEGATKLVRIAVQGAASDGHAAELGRTVAASALWRAAVHGADPNWGRIVSAIGAGHRDLDVASLQIEIGPETVFEHGAPSGSHEAARKAMSDDVIVVSCHVGTGPGSAEILSADLSPAYVNLNAEGTS